MNYHFCESAGPSTTLVTYAFQVCNQLTAGNWQLPGSQVGTRKFQCLETEVPCHLKSFVSGVYASVIFLIPLLVEHDQHDQNFQSTVAPVRKTNILTRAEHTGIHADFRLWILYFILFYYLLLTGSFLTIVFWLNLSAVNAKSKNCKMDKCQLV